MSFSNIYPGFIEIHDVITPKLAEDCQKWPHRGRLWSKLWVNFSENVTVTIMINIS